MMRSSDLIPNQFKDFDSYHSKDGNSPFTSAK